MNNDHNKSRLNKLPDHSTWKAGGDGVKNFIVKKMNILHSVILSNIIYVFGGQGTQAALMVAMLSLMNTVTFLGGHDVRKTSRFLEIHFGTRMVFDDANLRTNSSRSLCSKRRSVRCDDIG